MVDKDKLKGHLIEQGAFDAYRGFRFPLRGIVDTRSFTLVSSDRNTRIYSGLEDKSERLVVYKGKDFAEIAKIA